MNPAKYKPVITLVIFLLCNSLRLMAQTPAVVIDSVKKQLKADAPEESYVRSCFTIADNFMEIDQYDSAQLWLNKVAGVLPLKQPTLSNYFLSTRQAEVYYYNGLQRIGLQEAERSLSIATALKDGILLADSYNFLGLFYINLDSFKKAIPFLSKGIKYARQPPYPPGYLSLSKPHHLYGNIAEAYEKLGLHDSSLHYSRLSFAMASGINAMRGMAVAQNNMGTTFLKMGQADSSLYYFNQSLSTTTKGKDFDVELLNYGGLALASDLSKYGTAIIQWLQKGFVLLKEKPVVNNLFKGQFLDMAIMLYRKYKQDAFLMDALAKKADLLSSQIDNNNKQINVILNAGLQNETRLLNLQVKEAKQGREIANTRVYLLILLLVLLAAAFIFYRYKVHQQLQVVQMQNRISQDLHDDVGSSLSSLQVYSSVAHSVMDTQPAKAKEMLQKISGESAAVMENIGDIVWSMKTDKSQTMEERIKNYVADVLGAANISYKIMMEEGVENSITNITARRNILLIIKEAVSNIVKYSKAYHASVSIKKLAGQVCVQVADDGIGFNKQEPSKKGDGLSNMQQRTVETGGIFELTSAPGKGTVVSALFPLTKISDGR